MQSNVAAAAGDTSLADVDSIDTPPRVSPSASPAQPTRAGTTSQHPHGGTPAGRADGLDDIFGSRASSSSSSSSLPLHRRSDAAAVTAERNAIARSTAAHVPLKENLYRRRTSSRKSHPQQGGVAAANVAPPAAGGATARQSPLRPTASTLLAEQYGSPKRGGDDDDAPRSSRSPVDAARAPQPQRVSGAVVGLDDDGEASLSTDALLRRMQTKEREFDEKIHVIHDTFQNAGEQLVVRDSIIAQLQSELMELRAEARRVPQEYRAREEKFLLRVEDMMRELREEQTQTKRMRRLADDEVARLSAALEAAELQRTQQQRISEDLLRQLRASDQARQAEETRHATALHECQRAYEAKLSDFQRAYSTLEKQLVKSHAVYQEVDKDRAECQARLLDYEMSSRRQRSSDSLRCKALAAEKATMQETVEAVQLSMARLLRLMSEVPALADYLQWNELSSEFVFLGYPTRYFASGNEQGGNDESKGRRNAGASAQRTRSPRRQQQQQSRRGGQLDSTLNDRSANRDGSRSAPPSPYYQDINLSGESLAGTGVDDGVYAGVASSLSKNVWLNGRWAQQMMDIIAAENNYTRLKRIKLLELEEAAQLSEQLPSARDVLEGRQPERDYWIPFAVFTEAQRFKNKYYPKLPAMSHFYPFLIQLNKIWRAKLQDRLRVQRSATPQQKRQQEQQRSASAEWGQRGQPQRRQHDALLEREMSGGASARSATASQLDARRTEALLSQLVRLEASLDDMHAEHHRLRRDVRLHVSSQKSLQLFRFYDELLRSAHDHLAEAVQMANSLYDAAATQDPAEASLRGQSASATAAVLRLEQQQAELDAALVAAEEEKDRLHGIVERTCERVCGVGDALSAQMLVNYTDLHQLIQILHQHIDQMRTRTGNSASDHDVRKARDDRRAAQALQQRLRSMLHEQYQTSTSPAVDEASGEAQTAAAPLLGAVGVDSLLKVAASVLDFGEEVRKEVTRASAALRQTAEQAMREAGQMREEE